MASSINASTSAGLVQTADTSGVLQLQTAGTTAVTVDASQNVGIGGTPTNAKLEIFAQDGIRIKGYQPLQTWMDTNDANKGVRISTASAIMGFSNDTTGGGTYTERMRIDSSGNVKVANGDLILNNDKSVNFGNGTDTFNRISLNSGIGELELRGYAGFRFYTPQTSDSVSRMSLNNSGNLTIFGSTATKASGTTWANPSDIRLKDNIQDFNKGLTELLQVNVKTWEYNGKGGTTEGTKGIGVIADEIQTVLPETVDTYKAKLNIDDTEETDIKRFDATEITWLLVNAIQEQQTIINDLKARIETLEGAA
jgi:hypothetical protein